MNLIAAILIKMGFHSCTIFMKEHFIIQTQNEKKKEKIKKKSKSKSKKKFRSQNRKNKNKKKQENIEWTHAFRE